MSDHIVSAYDDQLNLINTNLIKLGGLVESQLKNAIKSLSDKDTSLADQVVNDDNKIDDLEKEIHELIYNNPTSCFLTFLSLNHHFVFFPFFCTSSEKFVHHLNINLGGRS